MPPLPDYLDEAGNISVAMDNLSVSFSDLHLLPKLLPVFRELYQEELFDIQLRHEQRKLRREEEEEERLRYNKLREERQQSRGAASRDTSDSPIRKKRAAAESS